MSESLDVRRKRLRYRSRYRGTKELDVLLGSFAEAHLDAFDAAQIGRFEALLEAPEPLITAWLLRREPPPADFDTDVLRLLLGHRPGAAGR
jgi:antitoxin CptB